MSIARARTLRSNMTDAEQALWQQLRRRQVNGFRFRRQFPLGRYIVDFVCLQARLIVAVDGGQHAEEVDYDAMRDAWLASQGFRVLRFWNSQVLKEGEAVVEEILRGLTAATPTPTLPRQGGGSSHRETKSYVGCSAPLPPPLAGGGEGEG